MANPRFIAKPDSDPEHEGDWVIFDRQENKVVEYGYDDKEQAEANIAEHFAEDFTAQTTKDAIALRRIAERYLFPDSPQQQEWLRIAERIETTGEAFGDGE